MCLADGFDDGGLSGATMERPALQHLLAEIQAGRVNIVSVYKVDRLTRSLGRKAAALAFPSVPALQEAVMEFCVGLT